MVELELNDHLDNDANSVIDTTGNIEDIPQHNLEHVEIEELSNSLTPSVKLETFEQQWD